MAASPVVYLFHGDDEVAMRAAVATLQNKLGDAGTADLNTARFEASALSFDELRNAALAAPFLTARRLVIIRGAGSAFSAEARARLIAFLDELPHTTALVLLENAELQDKHWLLKWAQGAGGRAFVRLFELPKGAQMATWIRERAKALGGEMQPQAAAALAQLVGNDKEAAEREIEKLLAYAAYQRPIEAPDVATISLPSGEQGDFFGLIDAISAGNGGQAMQALEKLLPERDAIMLFFSLVGHFRVLLQSREIVDAGKGDGEIAKQLGAHPYRAQKLAAQARRFSMATLKAIYERLLELDEGIKTGRIEPELAMETFVAELSVQAA